MQIARDCGYAFSCTYIPGINDLDALDRHALRRVQVEHIVNPAYFRGLFAFPGAMGLPLHARPGTRAR